MDYRQPFTQFLTQNWIGIALSGFWQGGLIVLIWNWQEDYGKILTIVVLAVFPITVLIARWSSELKYRLDALERSVEVERIFHDLALKGPDAVKRGREIFEETITELKWNVKGWERIPGEAKYFTVLTEELNSSQDGGEIWDVVMPLNPKRVGEPGYQPLMSYLKAIKKAIAERNIKYNLVVMASEKNEAEIQAAFQLFRDYGIRLHIVHRNRFPPHLRCNFSLYPHNRVVCSAERGDDATIIRGFRIRNDESEVQKKQATLSELRGYFVEHSPGTQGGTDNGAS